MKSARGREGQKADFTHRYDTRLRTGSQDMQTDTDSAALETGPCTCLSFDFIMTCISFIVTLSFLCCADEEIQPRGESLGETLPPAWPPVLTI